MMSVFIGVHVLFATIALVVIAVIDARRFEISPQWVLIASVNIIAIQLGLGVSVAELAIGTGFFGAVTIGYFLLFKQVRKRLGLGDLYLLPMLGLVFPSFIYIWPALICVSVLLVTHHIYLSYKRGKKLFQGHLPLAPAFCTMFGVFLWVKYLFSFGEEGYVLDPMAQVEIAFVSGVLSVLAVVWYDAETAQRGQGT